MVGGIGFAWFGMSGIIVGIAGIAGMGGTGKKPLNGGLELNDSGCV